MLELWCGYGTENRMQYYNPWIISTHGGAKVWPEKYKSLAHEMDTKLEGGTEEDASGIGWHRNGLERKTGDLKDKKCDFVTFALMNVKHSIMHRPRIGETTGCCGGLDIFVPN